MKKLILILLLGIFMISFGSAFNWNDGSVVSYYRLDDNLSTTNVIDVLGFNDGTLIGGNNTENISVPGIINLSLDFNGDDYISASSWLNHSDTLSISMWINQSSLGTHGLFSDITGGEGVVFYEANGFIQFRLLNGGTSTRYETDDVVINTTEFIHVVITKASGSTTQPIIYINGNSVSNTQLGDSVGADGISIGNIFSEFTDNGTIDEVGIWNRTLTPSEVLELYNNGDGLTFEFRIDFVDVELDIPLNNTLQSSNVTFNATLISRSEFDLTNATIFIWDLNGDLFFRQTNNITGNESNFTSFTVINLTAGNYEWNVFGLSENSTGFVTGNFSLFNNTFTWVPFEVDNEEFTLNVFETSRQDFLINITTLPSVLSVNAILNYNNTRFTADVSCVLGFCQISTAIDIPLVSTGEEENKSFLWEISIFDGTNSFSTNLTENEQNITRIHLQECGVITTQTLNFTSFDEQTQDPIDPFLFDASLLFWLGTGSVKRNNSLSNSSVSSIQLCFSPATETLFLDATIEYDEATGTNYTKRNYFFQNNQINNVSQDIKLGLLLSEDSTSFILKVQDRDILPVANILIFTERFYPGEGIFKTVQVSETDDNGRTVGFFETETVEYRFILKQNGTTVLTTNKQKIVGESVPFTLTFTIGDDEGSSWEPFEPIDDLESEILFNKTSSIISFTYLDTSGDFELGRLIVEKVNASGLQNTVICSETSVQSSATITCNLTGNSTGQYIMRGIITRSGTAQLIEQESFAIEDFSTIAGRLGLFLGWFIILISIFTFKFNEVAGIILVNLTIIFVNLIGLISFGYVFISAMIAISIIILVVLER